MEKNGISDKSTPVFKEPLRLEFGYSRAAPNDGGSRLAIGSPPDPIGKRHEVIMHAPVHVPLDRIRGKVAHQRRFCSFLPQFLDRCKVILHEKAVGGVR